MLLGSVAFAGTAFADDDSDPRDRSSHSRSSDDSSDSPKPARGSRSAKPDENLPSNIVKGTPCTDDAIACVSLGAQKAWLFKDGVISYGPVPVSTGGPGKQTPVGDHVVQWKHKDHTTSEFKTPQGRPAPMPFAVFFAEGGVAFHEGTLNRRSAGCVRLARKDAQFFYNFLQLGDKVEVRG
ncbi:L,D-transpeptidase [Pseudonocardia acaciae]|uniref:L,D-transpeptidase n=1 Tax=Pseudonocardia acaciae TaxID=551276 RepID=UPI00068421CE|nr:L,D-transpeptidase [Pseudonocardia acaciae]